MKTTQRAKQAFALVCLLILIAQLVPTAVFAQEPTPPWMDTTKTPEMRAQLLLKASTLEQKMRWLVEQPANNPTQTTWSGGVVYPPAVAGAPMIQYTDAPDWVSGAGPGVTAFPAQIGLTATWDQALSRTKGATQAWEAFYKQRNVILGPGLASGRTPYNGRNSEYVGEDPLLGGLMAAAMIRGIQEDTPPDVAVQAVLKHYIANEQELDRQRSSSNMDERTLYETYVLPYEIAIKEGDPGGIMCSFNQVNGVWACESKETLDDALKSSVGFKGWVVSDFGSVHSVGPTLVNGMDQELNRPRFLTPAALTSALMAGEITVADIDEAAFRVVSSHIKHGLFDVLRPTTSLPDVSSPEHRAVARQIAEEGTVLLKNADGILPLSGTGKTIAVIGPTASNTPTNGVSAATVCGHNRPGITCTPVTPLDAITARAALDGNTVVFDNGADLAAAATTAQSADVAIVFGYYQEGEGNDRVNLNLDNNGDTLIQAVAGANPNTIVILQTGGPVLMPWIGQVKGVLEVWYAGVEMGNAIANLLWGDVNPSGKLPQTFPVSEADLPTAGSPQQYPGVFADGSTTRPPGSTEIRQVYYTEGLNVGYRWYDAMGIEPLFPFGHGLSYTTFEYSDLQFFPGLVQQNKKLQVGFMLTNTGSVAGTEVAQVYLTLPAAANEPPQRLVGWSRVTLQPGETKKVVVTINPKSSAHPLSYWDTNTHSWVTAAGDYGIKVGSSSRDLRLLGMIHVQ